MMKKVSGKLKGTKTKRMKSKVKIEGKMPYEESKLDSDDDDDDDDIDENLSWSLLAKKKSEKCSKNKSGRKAKWGI